MYKAYEDSKVVTFITDGEFYGGGTHGIGGAVGTTFRKSDGKELTNDMISSYYDLKPYITEGLKEYLVYPRMRN